MSGDVSSLVGDTELICAVFCYSNSIACNPSSAVEIFDGTFVGRSSQDNILICPLCCVASNFQCGSNLVNFVNHNVLSGDISSLVGDTELICSVCGGGDAVAFDPSSAVEIFDGSVTGTCRQDDVLIGPAFCIAGNAQFRSRFVNIIDNELTCAFIACGILSTEINDSVVCNTEFFGVVQPSAVFSDAVLFDRTVFAEKNCDSHILIGQCGDVSRCRRSFRRSQVTDGKFKIAIDLSQQIIDTVVFEDFAVDGDGAVTDTAVADGKRACKVFSPLSQFVSTCRLICGNGDGIGGHSGNQRKIVDQIVIRCRSVRNGKINNRS